MMQSACCQYLEGDNKLQGYRLMVNQRRNVPGLHRQNAVRRWTSYGPQSGLFGRIIDTTTSSGPHVFDVVPARQRLFNIVVCNFQKMRH